MAFEVLQIGISKRVGGSNRGVAGSVCERRWLIRAIEDVRVDVWKHLMLDT